MRSAFTSTEAAAKASALDWFLRLARLLFLRLDVGMLVGAPRPRPAAEVAAGTGKAGDVVVRTGVLLAFAPALDASEAGAVVAGGGAGGGAAAESAATTPLPPLAPGHAYVSFRDLASPLAVPLTSLLAQGSVAGGGELGAGLSKGASPAERALEALSAAGGDIIVALRELAEAREQTRLFSRTPTAGLPALGCISPADDALRIPDALLAAALADFREASIAGAKDDAEAALHDAPGSKPSGASLEAAREAASARARAGFVPPSRLHLGDLLELEPLENWDAGLSQLPALPGAAEALIPYTESAALAPPLRAALAPSAGGALSAPPAVS
jgi:hypothetical protein